MNTMDRDAIQDKANRHPSDSYFGLCPRCGNAGSILHIEADAWGGCHQCQIRWHVGRNILSSWRSMSDDEFARNEDLLARYIELEPVMPEPWAIEAEHAFHRIMQQDKPRASDADV